MKTIAPYGTWQSNLKAEEVASGSARLAEVRLQGDRVFWLEGRPSEQGRNVIVMSKLGEQPKDILPAPWSARSRVHEYGGGAYAVEDHNIYFVNGACQQIYHLDINTGAISELTNTPNHRYANLTIDSQRSCLFAICEDHSNKDQEPSNCLVRIPLSGSVLTPSIIASGHDFYATPALSPDGNHLAFITWDHPNMPWDSAQLWLAKVNVDGALDQPNEIKNGESASFQPSWASNSELVWAADTNDWWNLYQLDTTTGKIHNLHPKEAEFATPLWTLNMRTYGALSDNRLFTTYTQNNQWQCGILEMASGTLTPITSKLNSISDVFTNANNAVFIGASSEMGPAIWLWSNNQLNCLTPHSKALPINDVSKGKPFTFSTTNKQTCYANFYAPMNQYFEAPKGDLPPVIVIGHGGPTGQADLGYSAKIQFWTQHGFAVVDVNYRGSTGYGRAYRNALKGKWGIYEVEDLCHAAEYVTQQGWAHPNKRIVRGSSAGGYSVLAALTDSNTFDAGVSLYGIGNLETLATDTHKFEARYLDFLVGPYPEQKQTYVDRSPVHKAHNICCPLIVFQGLEDKVVPPNQAEDMVNAVKAQGLPVVYVTYPGEGHGFRNAATVINQLEKELAFYKDIFEFN